MEPAERIEITLPELEVEGSARALDAARGGLAPLWAAGRLEEFLGSARGRAAMAEHDRLTRDLLSQFEEARRAGAERWTPRLLVSAETVPAWLDLVREVRRLWSDEELMARIGVARPPARDLMFVDRLLVQVEDALAEANGED